LLVVPGDQHPIDIRDGEYLYKWAKTLPSVSTKKTPDFGYDGGVFKSGDMVDVITMAEKNHWRISLIGGETKFDKVQDLPDGRCRRVSRVILYPYSWDASQERAAHEKRVADFDGRTENHWYSDAGTEFSRIKSRLAFQIFATVHELGHVVSGPGEGFPDSVERDFVSEARNVLY
jgi:hypothetical protein